MSFLVFKNQWETMGLLNSQFMRDLCCEILWSSLDLSFSRKMLLIPGFLHRSDTVNGQNSLLPLGIVTRGYNSVSNQMYQMLTILSIYQLAHDLVRQ